MIGMIYIYILVGTYIIFKLKIVVLCIGMHKHAPYDIIPIIFVYILT